MRDAYKIDMANKINKEIINNFFRAAPNASDSSISANKHQL